MPTFIPGLELNARFYAEAVRPILDEAFPDLQHSAALIGAGSDVLGYDTERSTDHGWGPRLLLFLAKDDVARYGSLIHEALATRLPPRFLGYSTHFTPVQADGSQLLDEWQSGPIAHKVEITSAREWFTGWLGHDPFAEWSVVEWLTVPQQRLLEVTAGRVYHDGLQSLHAVRKQLMWYPEQIWWYVLACQWQRISQQEAFVGRTAEIGDELGSRLITGDLVRDLARLAFLMERQYAPYSKWFGTALARLPIAQKLMPMLEGAIAATDFSEREERLCAAYEFLGECHNALGITKNVDPTRRRFYNRPYDVIFAERFTAALDEATTDPDVREVIANVGWIGAMDQFSDSVDLRTRQRLTVRAGRLYSP